MTISPRPLANRNDTGFTLVEILVAIVLVGVLSAVVVVGVSSLTGKGSSAACAASVDAASAASTSYFADTGSYPTDIQQMVDGGQLELADDVTVTAALVAEGSGWTMTMTPISATTRPAFSCS